jgi:hypothetical protein
MYLILLFFDIIHFIHAVESKQISGQQDDEADKKLYDLRNILYA